MAAAFAGKIHHVAGHYTLAFYVSGMLGLLAAALASNVRRAPAAVATAPAAGH